MELKSTNPDTRLAELGITLPPSPAPLGIYKLLLVDERHVYVSGHGPLLSNNQFIIGKVGVDMDIEEAKSAARQVGLAILATLKLHLGELQKIKRVIKVLGMVNSAPDFTRHPYVINGCSELFALIWGNEYGVGVRSAVGVSSLPDNIPVEIEALFELQQDIN